MAQKTSLGKVRARFRSGDFKKSPFWKITLVGLGVILALAIFEITLRLTEKQKYDYMPCTSLDKNFHHVMISGKTCRFKTDEWDVTYKINSFGLRDDEITLEKNGNIFRILLLGDSFAQGFGIEHKESFEAILETKLNELDLPKKVEIVNSGVFVYSPLVEYLYLKKRGLDFKPDMVILAFTITDFWDDRQRFNELKTVYQDLGEDQLWRLIEIAEAEFDFEKINTAAGERANLKFDRSRIVFLIKQWLRNNFRVYKTTADLIKKRDKVVQQDAIFRGDPDKDLMAIARGAEISDEAWLSLWEIPMMNIKFMADLLSEKRIPFVVVTIPDATQVSSLEWSNRKALGLGTNYQETRPPYQEELKKRLKNLNVEVVDLLLGFKESGLFPLYFANDNHWNSAGHKLAGEIISQELKTKIEAAVEK